MEEKKKRRAANYNNREKEVLISLVSKFKNIIENKKTDAVTVTDKNKAWFKVTDEFNAISLNNVFRPTESLKKYYENLKEDLRKGAGEERRSLSKTGGGTPSPKGKMDDDLLLCITNKKTIFGLENPFDNDSTETEARLNKGQTSNIKNIKTEDIGSTFTEINFQNAISSSSIFEVVFEDEGLEIEQEIVDVPSSPNLSQWNAGVQNDNNWAKSKPDNLKEPISASLKRNVASVISNNKCSGREVGSKTRKKLISSRRLPSTIKVLNSSTLAGKYNTLLDKKIELAECLKKEHEVRMKILRFDMAIKRKDMKSAGYTDIDIKILDSCELGV